MFFQFWFTMNTSPYQRDINKSLWPAYTYIIFCSYVFSCFYPWPYILKFQTSNSKSVDFLSITVYVFLNLFWKICPLFGQILSTFLNLSPISYSEKIHWKRGCEVKGNFKHIVRNYKVYYNTFLSVTARTPKFVASLQPRILYMGPLLVTFENLVVRKYHVFLQFFIVDT